IDIALKTHSNMFGADGLFRHCDTARSAAEALSDLQELLHSASLVSDWMLEDLRRHSAQRLLSFSILVARVFGAGNPAMHGNASGGSCTHG
uniref:Uncharacterized protein n=1 Tax=Paramormyrops kingsleyae TaxID=1676925 RepID=A0A3B3RVY5_9TELE